MEAGDVRAALAVERIQQLYLLEREATVRGLDAAAHLVLRQEQATPIVDALGQWIADVHPQAPPRSLLGKALRYALNQWTPLRRFLEDGALPLDTNGVERALRSLAVPSEPEVVHHLDVQGLGQLGVPTLAVASDAGPRESGNPPADRFGAASRQLLCVNPSSRLPRVSSTM